MPLDARSVASRYLPLIKAIARSFARVGFLDEDDLVQEGRLALERARSSFGSAKVQDERKLVATVVRNAFRNLLDTWSGAILLEVRVATPEDLQEADAVERVACQEYLRKLVRLCTPAERVVLAHLLDPRDLDAPAQKGAREMPHNMQRSVAEALGLQRHTAARHLQSIRQKAKALAPEYLGVRD